MKSKVYNQEGVEVGTVELPESVFGLPWNNDLVHQVTTAMQANMRVRHAHSKDRSEVSGGGRKPWMQKGTGRARHGSIRSPIWRGGGVTFGPHKERTYTQKINKKMKEKALRTVLSRKLKDGEVVFVDDLAFPEHKSAIAKKVLKGLAGIEGFDALATRRKNAAFIALGIADEKTTRSFRNFGNIEVGEVRNLNPLDVLTYKYLVISKPADAIAFLEKKKVVDTK